MVYLSRKFIAVLLLLWLPLFSGNALAAALSMQMQQGHCREAAASQATPHLNMGEHHQHRDATPAPAGEQNPPCCASGACHLSCAVYLALPGMELVTVRTSAYEITPYQVSFRSVTYAPLVPPPLARA